MLVLLKNMLKDTDEQINEAEGKVGTGLRHRNFCLHGVGVRYTSGVGVFIHLGTL